jgi:cation transport regulator ChaC
MNQTGKTDNPIARHCYQTTLLPPSDPNDNKQTKEDKFYYFAYGSCMCPVDLQRSLGENMVPYLMGTAILEHHRLGFYRRSPKRDCGVLDVVLDPGKQVHGVLYHLPWRLSELLDYREEVPTNGYRRAEIKVRCGDRLIDNVRTYMVVNKLPHELPPNDWYFNVVLRGAVTCGLPEEYCWYLFNHMRSLQSFPKTHPSMLPWDQSAA